jgi:hypothetical protein
MRRRLGPATDRTEGEVGVKIYGASDDLVELEGGPDGDDEIDALDRDVRITIGSDAHGGIVVVMSYAPGDVEDGVWQARLSPIAEDVACPWPVRVECKGYSAVVEIDCPRDVQLRVENRKQGKNEKKWEPIAKDGDE